MLQYTKETKEQALTLLKEGLTVSEVHDLLNVPTSTLYRWRDENSRETPTSDDENSREKLEKICAFLKNFSGAIIRKDIAAADKALSDAAGTFSEKIHQGRLDKLTDLLKQLEAL
jgi:transposase-like protein